MTNTGGSDRHKGDVPTGYLERIAEKFGTKRPNKATRLQGYNATRRRAGKKARLE
jgi:hypothetical protein